MTAILGISAFYHDAAAALIVDGRIVAAAQQERFSRVKNDSRFPHDAIDYCLSEAGLKPVDLDFVGFYEKPLLKFDRVLETSCDFAPRGFRSFAHAMPSWIKKKLFVSRYLDRALPGFGKRYVFAEHHQSHAASAFFPSPFEEAAILTVDGVGEWATAAFGTGRGRKIELTHEMRFPNSLGLLYSAFTSYCGFRVDSDEYKLMGLAPYGQPRYVDLIMERLLDVRPDGSMRLDQTYFNYCSGLTMTSRRFERLFGGPPRRPGDPIDERHMDLAASIQKVTEEILLRMVRHVRAETGLPNLCLAGGVALNCVANGRIQREASFDEIWIQPAAGDAGGALGVALLIHHQLLDGDRVPKPCDGMQGALLGPEFSEGDIRESLRRIGAKFHEAPTDDAIRTDTARLLTDRKIVGYFQGRMEFGPRALGARSILADARDTRMRDMLNAKIKFRESFRPFAPAVLADAAPDYFEVPPGHDSPYMMLTADVIQGQPPAPQDDEPTGLDQLRAVGGPISAVTHIDGSARVQTVDARRHPHFALLLQAYRDETGCPVLVNTSFNVRDEPIVRTPEEAYRCFMSTEMDALVLGRFLLLKEEQPSREPLGNAESRTPAPGAPRERLHEIDREPTSRRLRIFGAGLPAMAAIFSVLAMLLADVRAPLWTLSAIASVVSVVFWSIPTARRRIYIAWMLVNYPIGWLGALLATAVIYYLVVTPIGLARRLLGSDALDHRGDPLPSYWIPRPSAQDWSRYLRKF
jgi:carbamoyltransferase